MNIHLYANGPANNHGCEALSRCFALLLGNGHCLSTFSEDIGEDAKYGVNEVLSLRPFLRAPFSRYSLSNAKFHALKRMMHPDTAYYSVLFRKMKNEIRRGDLYVSIGGDNYCYGASEWLFALNSIIRKNGGRTVLAGCSLEPDSLTPDLLDDLKQFELVIARESITYAALAGKGIGNARLLPDPAFVLPSVELPLPDGFQPGNTVGVNISPLIMEREKKPGNVLENCANLITHILDHSDMSVALIPHVVAPGNDDRAALALLAGRFSSSPRVITIPDCNAMELKGYIARCRYMIAARTHASIAAYSQKVPTLVLGYSVKARGIARDIFGNEEEYVIPVQSIDDPGDLTRKYEGLRSNEAHIRSVYDEVIPAMIEKAWQVGKEIDMLAQSSR